LKKQFKFYCSYCMYVFYFYSWPEDGTIWRGGRQKIEQEDGNG
jgi:hypothetical protein